MEQMANTIYLQLFSPMSTSHFAQEDNQIQQLAESSGKGRYCGQERQNSFIRMSMC